MWQDNWKVLEGLGTTGQAKSFKVARQDGALGEYFLKELLDQNRTERRARMYREVSAYRTLDHSGIPKLIETNADAYEDKAVRLYLVTTFVPGMNVAKLVSDRGLLPVRDAITVTCKILEILAYVHAQETVHRDIKPENVMITSENPANPVIVDFGMAFLAQEEEACHTASGQEIGNRFLRLPEFQVDSLDKRDPRSDVTHCAALLIFMLTGHRPAGLTDAKGLPPHQRKLFQDQLQRHVDVDMPGLLDIFDRAFEMSVSARWSSAHELLEALMKIEIGPQASSATLSPEQTVLRIQKLMDSHTEKQTHRISETLDSANKLMSSGPALAVAKLGQSFGTCQGGYSKDVPNRCVVNSLGICKNSDTSVTFFPQFRCDIQGADVVVSVAGSRKNILFRCAAEELEARSTALSSQVAEYLLSGILKVIESRSQGPNAV